MNAAGAWVSVKTAMPGEGKQCLIRQKSCAFFTASIWESDENGVFQWSNVYESTDKKKRPVTHWAYINEMSDWGDQ